MIRAKYCFSIWVLGMAVVCSGVLQAQNEVTTYPGTIGIDNPCNASLVLVSGTNSVRIDDDLRDRGRGHDDNAHSHVSVGLRFIGYGQDAAGNPYRTVFIAKGQFGTEATTYDLPFHSMWIGTKGAPSFSVDGTVRVFAQGEKASGSEITHFETSCRAGDHDEVGDRDDSH
jgi:hypothetical protein